MAKAGTTSREEEQREWYAGGLRFRCTECGNCCTGPPGAVWFNDDEAVTMAEALGMTEAAFRKKFARKLNAGWSLNERKTAHGFDCIFLDRETDPGEARCRIYQARPTQCRTWPFWPENVESKDTWDATKHHTPCPGMDKGTLYSADEIRRRLALADE